MDEVTQKILITTPHPDDCEIGCGGTVARWVREGCEAVLVVCTNGDKGSSDPAMTSDKLAGMRQREQNGAAKALGIKEVIFLHYPDGELEDSREFRGDLVREIRRHKPDIVFTVDPFRTRGYMHRDHRMTGQVTLDAVFPYSRDHLSFPEHKDLGLESHKVGKVYLWGGDDPNMHIDITETIDLKVNALNYHSSQVGPERGRDVENFLRERARESGKVSGASYAEAFRVIEYRS